MQITWSVATWKWAVINNSISILPMGTSIFNALQIRQCKQHPSDYLLFAMFIESVRSGEASFLDLLQV